MITKILHEHLFYTSRKDKAENNSAVDWDSYEPLFHISTKRHLVIGARDVKSDKMFCIKMVDYSRFSSIAEAFPLELNILKEARFLQSLRHPMIPKLLGAEPNTRFICMEYVKGGRLDIILPTLSFMDKIRIFSDLSKLISYFQSQSVLHRDIKPQNILIQRKSGRIEARVLDFGSMEREVQQRSDHGPRKEKLGKGVYLFQPPEQLLSDYSRLDRRADCFSLGATAYMMFFGSTPYHNSESSVRNVMSSYQRQENGLWRSGKLQALPFELGELLFQLLRIRTDSRLKNLTDIQEITAATWEKILSKK